MSVFRDLLEIIIHEYETENNIQFCIHHFDSGEELLKKYREGHTKFDLLFLDNYMKKITGIKTALSIRKKYNTSCNIVFITSSDLHYEFMAAAPLAILSKPAQKESIYEVLDNVLAKHCR